MIKIMTFVGVMSVALTLSTSGYAAEAASSTNSVWPSKSQVMARLKAVGLKPQTDPEKGIVYYKCGYNSVDVLTGDIKQSSQSFFDYYAITQVTRKDRDPEIVGLKLRVVTESPKVVRFPDGGHTTEYYSKVEVERILNAYGPGYNLGTDDELLADLSLEKGFSGKSQLSLIKLGYREMSVCLPTQRVGDGVLKF